MKVLFLIIPEYRNTNSPFSALCRGITIRVWALRRCFLPTTIFLHRQQKSNPCRTKICLDLRRLRWRRGRDEFAWNRLTRRERVDQTNQADGKRVRRGIDRKRSEPGRALTIRRGGTNRFIDELSRIKAGPTGRPRAISHANVFPLNFEKLFYHRFPSSSRYLLRQNASTGTTHSGKFDIPLAWSMQHDPTAFRIRIFAGASR